MSETDDLSPREHRVKKQDLDSGDPQDTVWIALGHSGTQNPTTYHNDKHCVDGKTTDDMVDKTRATAQRSWKKPCCHCVIGGNDD